jgi:hypothetical protein
LDLATFAWSFRGATLTSPREYRVDFKSPAFLHGLMIDVRGCGWQVSDNWIDLYPGEEKRVTRHREQPIAPAEFRRRLTWKSLLDQGA